MRLFSFIILYSASLAFAGLLESVQYGQQIEHLYPRKNPEAGELPATSDQSSIKTEKPKGGIMEGMMKQSPTVTEVIIIWVNLGGPQETKTLQPPIAPAAVTHKVIVGGDAGLVYVPEKIEANVGDMVIFQFLSSNHSATQSSFDTPCIALPNGIDTGFMANVNNAITPAPEVAMQVMVLTPIWFYCKQKSHCGKGMTFSINAGPPGSGKSHLDFKQKAIQQNNTGSAPPILGGGASKGSAPPSTASPKGAAPPNDATPSPDDSPKGAAPPNDATPPKGVAQPSVAPFKDAAPSKGVTPPSMPPPVVVPGTGINNSGACSCSCLCGVASFPNLANQGIGSYGGMSGALPMSAMEV